MKFLWTTINVKDMESSLKFYKEVVGLTVDRTMKPNENMQIAFLGSGETKVELIYDGANKNRSYSNDISIGFEVESLEATIELLKGKGIKVEGGPFQPNPMIKFIYVLDPNGMRVQFVENIKK